MSAVGRNAASNLGWWRSLRARGVESVIIIALTATVEQCFQMFSVHQNPLEAMLKPRLPPQGF